MPLPNWTRNLLARCRRWREQSARRELLEPVRLSLRKLEERRVLDVSAAFATATGLLEIELTNTADVATLSNANGDVGIEDAAANPVAIEVDGGGPGPVNISDVRSVVVRGDDASNQQFVLETPLVLRDGLRVEDSIELASINQMITRVDSGGITLDSLDIELGADLEATGLAITFGGNVSLTNSVTLTGEDVLFAGMVNDDGDGNTSSSLLVNASGLSLFAEDIGGGNPIDSLRTDALGRTEISGDITAVGNTITFNDPLVLNDSVTVTDAGTTGIRFNDTVDSAVDAQHSLTATATNGSVTFSGDIGNGAAGDQSLGNLIVTEAAEGVIFGDKAGVSQIRVAGPAGVIDIGSAATIGGVGIRLNGGSANLLTVTSAGLLRWNGPTTLVTDVDLLHRGNVVWTADAPLDSGANSVRRLKIDPSPTGAVAVRFNEDIGRLVPLAGLEIRGAGEVVFGGAGVETPGTGGEGPVELVRSTGPISISSDNVVFDAGDGNTLLIETTGDDVSIDSPDVELRSHASIDTGTGGGDIQFESSLNSVASLIDSEAGERNDLRLNAGRGSVVSDGSFGSVEALGSFVVESADNGVTIGSPGVFEPTIHAVDGIDIGTGTNVIGGSGISFIADSNGQLRTEGSDLRLNGAFILEGLAILETGAGGGDVIFTSDAPIVDGLAGSLIIRAGTGAVRFNEDIAGGSDAISLTIDTEGEVFLGESLTETGPGGTGPVEIMNLDAFRVGSPGASAARIVFTGSPTSGATLSANQNALFHGPVELATDLTIATRATNGEIVFAQDSTIDSAPGTASALTIAATGVGDATFFNADIGGVNPLSSLLITTEGHVAFGGTTSPLLNGGVGGPVNLVRTVNGTDIGVGTLVAGSSDGLGIALNGGDREISLEVLNGNLRLNGALRAQSDVRLDTAGGNGDILLTSAASFDSHDGPSLATAVERNGLTLNAGDGRISINANIGETQRAGPLTVERAGGGLEIGGAEAAVVGGLGPVTQILTDGPIAFGSVEQIVGGIGLNGGSAALAIETSADNIDIDGAVELRSNVELSTGAGGGDLNLSPESTLDSQPGEANDVKITLDSGSATLSAAIGGTNRLGELRFMSASDVTVRASVDAARVSQDAGSGTTRFAGSVTTTDAARSGIELSGTDFIFDAPVTTSGDGRVSITHSGLLDINDAADMRLEGSFRESGGGSVETAASIVTTGDTIVFESPVKLTDGTAAEVLLDTTGAGNTAGADVRFEATLDGESDGIERLTINAGESGDVQFLGAVGGMMRLGPLDVVNANDLTADGAIIAARIKAVGSGTTTFNGVLDTNDAADRGVDLTATNVNLNNTVRTAGDGRVEITVSGLLDIATAADMDLSGSFLQDGGGRVETAGSITTSDAGITFSDAVVVQDDLRFTSGLGAGDIRFESTLDGTTDCEEDLVFSAGTGDIQFAGAFGGQVGLGSLQFFETNDLVFRGSATAKSFRQEDGTGETRFDGPLTIKAEGIGIATRSVTINDALSSTNTLTATAVFIETADSIRVNGSIQTDGARVALLADDDVSLGRAASVSTMGGAIDIQAGRNRSSDPDPGGALILEDGSLLEAGNATIQLFAEGDVQLGRVVTTADVRVVSANGGVIDGGDAGGADIVSNRLGIESRDGIGTANPIDTSINAFAANNRLVGGVRIENSGPDVLTILPLPEVTGSSISSVGVLSGPFGLPHKMGGDIEIIHVGEIAVENRILNTAGGNTTLRAELAGDLIVNAPIQNRGGDGWIFLISGEDLIINDSLPEPEAEISVQNEGAIRGIANEEVIVDNSETDYVIIRTHEERSIAETGLMELDVRFSDPTQAEDGLPGSELFPDNLNTQFYRDLELELTRVREEVAPQITNVDPIFSIEAVDQGGSDIDSRGRGILRITIGNEFHLERNWHLTVDWGDGNIESYTIPGNPQASLGFFNSDDAPINLSPDATITPRLDSGELNPDGTRSPGVYFVHHTYLANPNAEDPAAPIPVVATLRPDARSEGEAALDLGLPSSGSSIFNGIRFFANGTQELLATAEDGLTNPGAGVFGFVVVVESVIIPVESRESTDILVTQTAQASSVASSAHFELSVASFEGEVFERFRLFMRVVDDVADREGDEEFELPLDRLDDPLSLFRERTFPNGHYRIYLEEIRTGRVRLIVEVHIYEGRFVPKNFRESAGERQPGSDEGIEQNRIELPRGDNGLNPPGNDSDPPLPAARPAPDNTDEAAADPLLAVPLAAAAALPWRRRVRQAIESNTRPVNRARLRLQRLRRSPGGD